MTASLALTPSQARFVEEHKARRERFAAKAKPDTPILCLSASARSQRADVTHVVKPAPITPVKEWAERQLNIWFSIVDEIDPPTNTRPTIGLIQRLCAGHYDLSITELLADCRRGTVVRARQVAIFLCKELTMRSMPEIGRKFGDRDHTTVLHSIRKIQRLKSSDNDLADDLATLRKQIREAC